MPKMSEWQNYGGLSVKDNGAAEPVVDGTPRKITAWDTAMPTSAQATSDPVTGNDIQVSDAGDYQVTGILSFAADQNHIYEFTIYVNAAPTNFEINRKISNSGDVGGLGLGGIVTLAANDKVSISQRSIDGGASMTIISAQFYLSRLV